MIINWKKHCEKVRETRLLSTKDVSDKKKTYEQEVMFVKYLLFIGKDKTACFAEWSRIKNGIAHEFKKDIEQQLIQFRYIYNAALRTSDELLMANLEPVVIYQEEVDYLNSLNAPSWMKQYWAIMLVNYKFQKQLFPKVKYNATLRAWAFRQIKGIQQRYSNHAESIRKQEEAIGTKIINSYVYNDRKARIYYNMSCCQESGTPALELKDIDEAKKILTLISKNSKVCSVCGKHFTINSKTKRDLCDNCYKKYRRTYKTEFERKRRSARNI